MNTIKKTGLNFVSGAKLTANDLIVMNNTINALVDVVNAMIMSIYDINQESEDYETTYGLAQAVQIVSSNRRQLGMKIRFLTEGGLYAEYSYVGSDLNDANFLNTDNWVCGIDVVDGGEF